VAGGSEVARGISRHLAAGPPPGVPDGYAHVVASRDYHRDPGGHFSAHPDFATSWPPHCVIGTPGADFHPDLDTGHIEAVFSKGEHAAAYSAFEGADDGGAGLAEWLRDRGVTSVDVAGLATDHCVRATATDAATAGFATRVLLSLTAGVAADTVEAALAEMRTAGAELAGTPLLADAAD
jgi:nicotinamidase/pyrazinamidase